MHITFNGNRNQYNGTWLRTERHYKKSNDDNDDNDDEDMKRQTYQSSKFSWLSEQRTDKEWDKKQYSKHKQKGSEQDGCLQGKRFFENIDRYVALHMEFELRWNSNGI